VFASFDEFEPKIARARSTASRTKKIIIAANADLAAHRKWVETHRTAWSSAIKGLESDLRSTDVRAVTQLAVHIVCLPFNVFKFIPATFASFVKLTRDQLLRCLVSSFVFLIVLAAADALHDRKSIAPAPTERLSLRHQAEPLPSPLTTTKSQTSMSHGRSKPAQGFRVFKTPPASDPFSKPAQGFRVFKTPPASDPFLMPPRTVAMMVRITDPGPFLYQQHVTVGRSLARTSRAMPKHKRASTRQKPQQLPWLRELPWIAIR
jgi:hypothetical protein